MQFIIDYLGRIITPLYGKFLTFDILAYAMLGLIALTFVLYLVFGALTKAAKMKRFLHAETGRLRGYEEGADNVHALKRDLAGHNDLSEAFNKYVTTGCAAPSKFVTYDLVVGGRQKQSCVWLDIVSATAVLATFVFGVFSFAISGLLILAACEILLYAIARAVIKAIAYARYRALHGEYLVFAAELDRKVVECGDEYLDYDAAAKSEEEEISYNAQVQAAYQNALVEPAYDNAPDTVSEEFAGEVEPEFPQTAMPSDGYVNPYLQGDTEQAPEADQSGESEFKFTYVNDGSVTQPTAEKEEEDQPLFERFDSENAADGNTEVDYGSGNFVEAALANQIDAPQMQAAEEPAQTAAEIQSEEAEGITDEEIAKAARDIAEMQLEEDDGITDEEIENAARDLEQSEDDEPEEQPVYTYSEILESGDRTVRSEFKPELPQDGDLETAIREVAQAEKQKQEQSDSEEQTESDTQKPLVFDDEYFNKLDIVQPVIKETVREQAAESVREEEIKKPAPIGDDREELQRFLARSKKSGRKVTAQELVDKAKLAEQSADGGDESMRTMQQVALLLQKERERKGNKTAEDQRRMNEALADLLRAMGKNRK